MNDALTDSTPISSRVELVETILVSSDSSDHQVLQRIFTHTRWSLLHAEKLAQARRVLEVHSVGVVICRESFRDGSWEDVLRVVNSQPIAPKVMLAALSPSKGLWNVALQSGADSILTVPFAGADVLRSVADAWYRWWYQQARSAGNGIDLKAFASAEVRTPSGANVADEHVADAPVRKPAVRETGLRAAWRVATGSA